METRTAPGHCFVASKYPCSGSRNVGDGDHNFCNECGGCLNDTCEGYIPHDPIPACPNRGHLSPDNTCKWKKLVEELSRCVDELLDMKERDERGDPARLLTDFGRETLWKKARALLARIEEARKGK